jgi:hypothetical protein
MTVDPIRTAHRRVTPYRRVWGDPTRRSVLVTVEVRDANMCRAFCVFLHTGGAYAKLHGTAL